MKLIQRTITREPFRNITMEKLTKGLDDRDEKRFFLNVLIRLLDEYGKDSHLVDEPWRKPLERHLLRLGKDAYRVIAIDRALALRLLSRMFHCIWLAECVKYFETTGRKN